MQKRTLGGDRIGSGKKMKVDTKTFNRSTHDLGYILRTTMSAGTLVPFMCEVALPGDNFDINLGASILTLPTVGPLFGSFKVQLDVYQCPVRLYQGQLHNNKLGIGMNMAAVKLPNFKLEVPFISNLETIGDVDNSQINPSSIFKYLGISGMGTAGSDMTTIYRTFNAVPWLAYWDIVKNYYCNKQEQKGWVIHTTPIPPETNVSEVQGAGIVIPQFPLQDVAPLGFNAEIIITLTGAQDPSSIFIQLDGPTDWLPFNEICTLTLVSDTEMRGTYKQPVYGDRIMRSWRYKEGTDITTSEIELVPYDIDNIDIMRERILAHSVNNTPFNINEQALEPYSLVFQSSGGIRSVMGSQEGLAVKTYQSDLFNNWLNTEYIDGDNGISAVTAVSVTDNEFTIDSLILHRKVYDMLNDVLVSGGSYDDWQEVVYDHVGITRAETPIYYGSLIKELQFQEVVSNSESKNADILQPLGT